MKKTNAFLLMFAGVLAVSASTAFLLNNREIKNAQKVFSSSAQVWGHYQRLNPTLESAGSQEFWVGCNTHEILFEEPEESLEIIERGTPSLEDVESWKDLDDGRYLPKWRIDEKHVQFGEYPQEKVTDVDLLADLEDKLSVKAPTSDAYDGWTMYDYYASGNPLTTCFYQDLRLGAYRYRAVYYNSYRPSAATNASDATQSVVDDNGYNKNTLYFFKYSPITWRLLNDGGTTYKVLSTTLIDSNQFYHLKTNEATPTGYANHYGSSDIRSFLNGALYNNAFNSYEKSKTVDMDVNNSNNTPTVDSDNTNDKVTLLSFAEARSAAYGFPTNNNATETRVFPASDYAKSQGQSGDYALLRTAATANTLGEKCYDIKASGAIESNLIVFTRCGLAPIITINIE